MILSRAHVEFWAFHSRPQWTTRVTVPRVVQQRPDVNLCVNAHAGWDVAARNDAIRERSNFLSLLALSLRNDARDSRRQLYDQDTASMLLRIVSRPHPTDTIHRQVWARRVIRRYLRAKLKAHTVAPLFEPYRVR